MSSKLPFVIFLTKKESNPGIEVFWELIKNKFFDKRNVFVFQFPSHPEEKVIIHKKLSYFFDYYNSRGSTDQEIIISLNIMIAGQAGAGKSTLQNLFKREKIAKEGEGGAITYKISFYSDKNYNLTKIDTPCLENEKTVKYVRKALNDIRDKMKASKDHIDCIIYLIKSSSDRIFYEMEKELIKEIDQYEDIDVFFDTNTFGMEEESDEYYKNKEIIEDSLSQIMREIPCLNEEKIDKILDSITYVNLVKKMKDIRQVLVNCYGIDKLLGKIYELMSKKKINETEIINAKDLKELTETMKKYPLLKMFRERADFKMKNRISLSKYILSCAKSDYWKDVLIVGLFTLDSRRLEMIKKIGEYYGEQLDAEKKLEEINDKIKNSDWKKYRDDFFESMMPYKQNFKASGFDFNPSFYNEYTIAIGSYLLKKYEENTNLFDKNAKNIIFELSRGINIGIEGLRKLCEEWKQVQKDLEEGKSNMEWARRFFKLDKRE